MAGKDIPDRGPEILAVTGLFLGLSVIFSCLRFYARAIVVKQIGSDDWLAFAAQFCYIGMCVCCIIDVHWGMGKKTFDIVPLTNVPTAVMYWWICELWYLLASLLLKLSMGIFLLRIATQKKIRIIIWVIIVCTVIGTGYFFLQFLLQCWPVSYFWTSILDRNSGGKCLKSTIIINSAYAYSAVTCAVDLALCVVPILMVSKLQLNKRTKLSVMGVLSLWFLASVTTFIRLPYLKGIREPIDFLYETADLGIWSLAEVGISIMCIAAATLRPLMHKGFWKNPSQRGTSNTNTFQHSQTRSGSNWPSGAGGIGSPRGNVEYYGGVRSGERKGVRMNEEDIGMAMGYSDDDVELKSPQRAYTGSGTTNYSGSTVREGREPVRFGTTTYVKGGAQIEEKELKDESRHGSVNEEVNNADFVYGYGIRATTVVETRRE